MKDGAASGGGGCDHCTLILHKTINATRESVFSFISCHLIRCYPPRFMHEMTSWRLGQFLATIFY